MRWLMAVVALSLVASSADARGRSKPRRDDGPDPGPFARGRSRVSLSGGSSGQFGNRYFAIGGGFGYFVANGLELGIDMQVLFGEEPQIYTVSPEIRYVVWQVDPVRPYIGAFLRHQFIDGQVNGVEVDDISSAGGRVGVLWTTGRSYLAGGVAYEKIISCDESQVEFCEEFYPEFGVGLSF